MKMLLMALTAGLLLTGCDDKAPNNAASTPEGEGKAKVVKASATADPAGKAAPAADGKAAPAADGKAAPAADGKTAPAADGKAAPTADGKAAPTADGKAADGKPAVEDPGLRDPSKATETAPATFKVQFSTTKGAFVVEVTRAWAPLGADRFYNMVKVGFFNDIAFFRVIKGFMGQFGIHGDPAVATAWRNAKIDDDPVKESNARGMLTFAMAGKNTRTTQLFINLGNNKRLDGMGFPPFGTVVKGMDIVDQINSEYGEGAPRGKGPHQGRVQQEGNRYLKKDFPRMDYIKSALMLK